MNLLERAYQYIRAHAPFVDHGNPEPARPNPSNAPAATVSTSSSSYANSNYCRPLMPTQGEAPNYNGFNVRRIPNPASGPLPWQQLPEREWVPAVMCLFHSIRALDAQVEVPSNEGQGGFRLPEFQLDSERLAGLPSVGWQPHTYSTFRAETRFDSGILETVIRTFFARYDNEALDASARSPFPFGRSILGVDGFFARHGEAWIPPVVDADPTRPQYNFLNPPPLPLTGTVNLCTNYNDCLFELFYQFQGLIGSFASGTDAGSIVGFWSSLGHVGLYRNLHYPAGSVDMTQRDFFEHIVRPYFSPMRARHLATHRETWSINPDLFSFGHANRAFAQFLMSPVESHFPDGSTVSLGEASNLNAFFDRRIGELRVAPEGETALRRSQRLQLLGFLENLRQGYRQQSDINLLSFVSRNLPNSPSNADLNAPLNRVTDDNASHFIISSPAIDLHMPFANPNEYLRVGHVLARDVEFIGPSLADLGRANNENTTPIQVRIHAPFIGGVELSVHGMYIRLPEMRADDITLTLPSISRIAEVLGLRENDSINFAEVLNHWQQLLPYCRLSAHNLRLEGSFEARYDEFELNIRGQGGLLNNISLVTEEPESSNSQRRIPHLTIDRGVLRQVDSSIGVLGTIHGDARENTIDNFEVFFPYNRILVRTPLLSTEGTLTYDATPISPPVNGRPVQPNPNVPTRIYLGDQSANRTNRTEIRNVFMDLDFNNPDRVGMNLDCDLHSEIAPGSVVFPNPNFRVDLEGGNIRGAHLQSSISFGRSGDSTFTYRTAVRGPMELRFAGHVVSGDDSAPMQVVGDLSDVVASSNNACVYFNHLGELMVSGRDAATGAQACNLESLRVPNHHTRALPARHVRAPITLRGSFTNTHLFLRHLPAVGVLEHHLNGQFNLGVEGFWRNGNLWEGDLVDTGLSNLTGRVSTQEHHVHLVSRNPSPHRFQLGRLRVQGNNDLSNPVTQAILRGLNIYLVGHNGHSSSLEARVPYIGYYDGGQVSVDLLHSFIRATFRGLPPIFWSGLTGPRR